MIEYDTEWIPHLLKCSIIDSRNVLSWWTEPQNSPLWVQPHVWTSVSSSYAQYFHPPCTGTEQSRRGPASISMMRHPSYDSLGPRFVLHLDKKRQHCRRLCVFMRRLRKRPCFSHKIKCGTFSMRTFAGGVTFGHIL